jgi:LPPG:FO 2-phospho-L-lactate transferase
MGITPSALAVANHYGKLLRGFVFDKIDLELSKELRIPALVSDTIMKTAAHRRKLAEEILSFAEDLNATGPIRFD